MSGYPTYRELTRVPRSGTPALPNLLREIHAAKEVLEARVRTQSVDPHVSPQEIWKVGRSYLISLVEVLEGSVPLSQASVNRGNHVRRDETRLRLTQPLLKNLLRLQPLASNSVGMRQ